jgi:MinD-like ATPase involved in chromosome partitioning or flagellar assembly
LGKIISVHSFRGGTGKSNLTANLAVRVACLGNRVGIIDTDIQSPGIHVLFGLKEQQTNRSLNDYLWGRCPIEETAYNVSEFVRHEARTPLDIPELFLIPSSLKIADIARILQQGYEVSLLNDGFRALIKELKLDYLFIDTHPGVNEETLLSIAISDQLLVVLRPDHQDFQGTAVTVELARKLDVPKMYLLVNKVPAGTDIQELQQQVESIYRVPMLAAFPLNMEMLHVASGGIFCLRYPDHPFSEELERVAVQLTA